MGAYRGLSDSQKAVASQNHLQGTELYPLRDALVAADPGNEARVRAFIRADNYVTSYATQVAWAMWGEQGKIIGVQVRSVYDPVVRWRDRRAPEAPRPAATFTDLGWVPAMEWPGQDREAFSRSFRAWADSAGIAPQLETASTVLPNEGGDQ